MKADSSRAPSSQAVTSAPPQGRATGQRRPAFVSYLIACLPSFAFALLLASYSLFYYFQGEPGPHAGQLLAQGLAATGALALLFLLLLPLVYGRPWLPPVVYALLYSTLLWAGALLVLERGLRLDEAVPARHPPAAARYTLIQESMQRLLARRGTHTTQVFRGTQQTTRYNTRGWPDEERAFSKQGPRILFIGDSFLEVKSSRNLAQRVEEKLRLHDDAVEVINLSLRGTAPTGYRYRLFELAFDYEPDHIVVFLYAGNDLDEHFAYQPYTPTPFHVTPEALDLLRSMERFPERVLQSLVKAQEKHLVFARKEALFAALDEHGLSLEDKTFVYLAVFAYSAAPSQGFPLEDVAPHTLTRLTTLWERVSWSLPQREVTPDQRVFRERATRRKRYVDYWKTYNLPAERRLERIAELAARHNNLTDSQPFLDKLQTVDSLWLAELLAEPDASFALWPAITKLVLDEPAFSDPHPEAVQGVVEEHLKLFKECVEQAQRHGVEISFVLVPEASQVDEAFYQFWLSVFDYRQWRVVTHTTTNVLAEHLPSVAPTLNLLDHKEALVDSYWHFDGHWNERGNAVVADIVTDYLLHDLNVIRRR